MKEKTADELFEELGYNLEDENYYTIEYQKNERNRSKFIRFDLLDKSFTFFYYALIRMRRTSLCHNARTTSDK